MKVPLHKVACAIAVRDRIDLRLEDKGFTCSHPKFSAAWAKWLLVPIFLFAATLSLTAQSKHPILRNGNPSNRVDIVILSEGYTANQTSKFLADATNVVNQLLSQSPFSDYRSFFNATAIAVASAESGSDHPSWPQFRNTYFNSVFDEGKNTITIPPHAFDLNYANGRGKVDTLLNRFTPHHDLVILLVNDLVYGGSGGDILVASTHVASDDLLLHEAGHALAGLGDEYTRPNPGYVATEEPNTTQERRRNFIKWKHWIEPETPIPTPTIGDFAGSVGLFEGAQYHSTGWYRPQINCKMRDLGEPFCKVCSEALILSIYSRVRPIERKLPRTMTTALSQEESVSFQIQLLQPDPNHLEITWFTNRIEVPNAKGTNLTLVGDAFYRGSNVVSARVQDRSPAVRNDPGKLMTQVVKWNVFLRERELLWRHKDGRIAAWFLDGTNYLGSAIFDEGRKIGTNWVFSGFADFNDDGIRDFLWKNKNTGALGAWLISGFEVSGSAPVALGKTALPWRVASLPDLDRNGSSDILWRNSEGRLAAWLMDTSTFVSAMHLNDGKPVTSSWKFLAGADFDADGHSDFLWQTSLGKLRLWHMNGTQLIHSQLLLDGKSIAPQWRFVGAADFGFGDTSPSLLWLHDDGRLKLLRIASENGNTGALLRKGPTRTSEWSPLGLR